MSTVTLSENFEVLMPQEVCEALHLTPGEQLRVIAHADRVELVPVRLMQSLRGFLSGMDTSLDREEDRH